MSDNEHFRPTFTHFNGSVTYEDEEIYVRGIGNKLLGIGRFAGSIMATEQNGSQVAYPLLEIQGELLLGGEVDLWSTDQALIAAHRNADFYPATLYAKEERAARSEFQDTIDKAIAASMGVQLDLIT